MPTRVFASLVFLLWIHHSVSAQRPNVLILLADDLGVDYVGAYGEGAAPARTPNIDALAARGVLFRNAWASSSCSPTRASILTGRSPSRTLIGRWINYPANVEPIGTLRPGEWTFPESSGSRGNGVLPMRSSASGT